MNDFVWGDVNDQEIEAIHSDLLSIHEVIGKSCPSSSEQTFTAVLFHYDTDRTNNELDSIDGDNDTRKNNLMEDFSSESLTICSKRSLELKDDDPDYTEEDDLQTREVKHNLRKRKMRSVKKRKYQSSDELMSTKESSDLTELNIALAEEELHQLIISPTDPVGKVRTMSVNQSIFLMD